MGKVTFDYLKDRGAICEENEAKVAFMQSEAPFSVGEITFI